MNPTDKNPAAEIADAGNTSLACTLRNQERLESGIRILTSFAIGTLRGAKASLEHAGKARAREE